MDYKGYVEELKNKCDVFLQQVDFIGNECAYTDRLLEDIFTSIARLKDLYDKSDVVEYEIKTVRTMDELRAYLEDKGWQVSECGFGGGHIGWEIGQSSPAGEDFWFSIEHDNDVEQAIKAIEDYAYDFDVEEHVQLNIGMQGAPGVAELVEDAKAIQEMLDELAEHVEYDEPEEEKSIEEVLADAQERSEDLDTGEVKSDVELDM